MSSKLKNYAESIDYLYSGLSLYQRDGKKAIKLGLKNITSFCKQLENPQNTYPTIHVAGTNGKGSTSHMIAAILQAAGYRVGLYTSPHYRDFRERIKINGDLMPKRSVTRFLNKNRSIIDEIWPTFFEITVAMAFTYFAEQQVDIAIIETGMGGRLDSTNIITPICSVITNISYDHQDSLGYTLTAIAREKAGIIKSGVPVIIGESHVETQDVFIAKAHKMNAPLYWSQSEVQLDDHQIAIDHQRYVYYAAGRAHPIYLQAGGPYQIHNLRTALACIQTIASDYSITMDNIKTGTSQLTSLTRFIGRWQVVNKDPLVIADAAHNEEGINQLLTSLQILQMTDLHIVFGLVKGKDPKLLLSKLPISATYYFCAPKLPRALDVQLLSQAGAELGFNSKSYTSVGRALAAAKLKARLKDHPVLVTGSSYVVAEVV